MRRLVLLAFLLHCAFCYPEAPSRKDVNILSADGIKLRATFYPTQHPGPAVLLLHMCNTTRQSWKPVAALLSSHGISALTLDNRGRKIGEEAARIALRILNSKAPPKPETVEMQPELIVRESTHRRTGKDISKKVYASVKRSNRP